MSNHESDVGERRRDATEEGKAVGVDVWTAQLASLSKTSQQSTAIQIRSVEQCSAGSFYLWLPAHALRATDERSKWAIKTKPPENDTRDGRSKCADKTKRPKHTTMGSSVLQAAVLPFSYIDRLQ